MVSTPSTLAARPLSPLSAWLEARLWILGWWAVGRAVVLGAALAVHFIGGPDGYLHHDVHDHVLGILDSWDGLWYERIAAHGYLYVTGQQSNPAFFPLLPVLLRGAGSLGIGYAVAGILLSNLALLVALVAFHALTRDHFDDALARRATTYLAIFPFGFVFSMTYPQSLALAAVALAALAANRGRWAAAIVLGTLAALARPEGLFVALPLAATAWRQRRELSPTRRGLALGAIAAPLVALASFPLYLGSTLHDPLAWHRAELAWGRRFSPIGFVRAIEQLPDTYGHHALVVRDVVAVVLYLALLVVAARAGAPWWWLLAGLAVVALPLESGSFDSIGRFGLLAPAVFWGLAALGDRRRVDLAIRVPSLVLLAAATVTIPLIFP